MIIISPLFGKNDREEVIDVNFTKEKYKKFVKAHAPRSPLVKNCLYAFLVGGSVCTLAQGLTEVYKALGYPAEGAGTLCSVTLIAAAAALTGFGVFDKIARFAGAGTLVPITGFANAVVSPAMDAKAEGYVLGVGAKIFTVAGPVLLYGTAAGALYGVLYWLFSLFL